MNRANKVGLICGAVLGVYQLVWLFIYALGFAPSIADFVNRIVTWAHINHISVSIGKFDATASIFWILADVILGYAVGYLIYSISNRFRNQTA